MKKYINPAIVVVELKVRQGLMQSSLTFGSGTKSATESLGRSNDWFDDDDDDFEQY